MILIYKENILTKTNLNTIKPNIVTIMLALICISCTPVNNIAPESNRHTNSKENNQNLFQESQKTKASKLEIIGKNLEDQNKQEYMGIAKIDTAHFDFLGTFKADHYDQLSKYEEIEIKRILYSSLNYEKQKIETLKEILEKLNANPKHKQTAKHFIYQISPAIQYKLNIDLSLILEAIKDKLHTLNPKKAEELLMQVESDLKLKQRFAETLNATLEAYNQNSQNILNNDEELAKHMDENYKDLDSFNPIN